MIRAVLFDAFGTLFRPRAPIHVQYAQVAESYGLVVKAEDIKTGFRKAFKEVSAQHPLYGKHSSPPLHYEDWWSLVIERTFEHADVASSDLQITLPTLLPALMERFASREGYVLHDDVLPALQHLKNGGFKLGILSNSDPRTIKVIESLGIVPDYIPDDNITLSWHVGKSKPNKEIFEAAVANLGFQADETLMIGDDLDEDYHSAKAAGLQAVLLRRERNEADYVRREMGSPELENVPLLGSMAELPRWIEKYNNS